MNLNTHWIMKADALEFKESNEIKKREDLVIQKNTVNQFNSITNINHLLPFPQ